MTYSFFGTPPVREMAFLAPQRVCRKRFSSPNEQAFIVLSSGLRLLFRDPDSVRRGSDCSWPRGRPAIDAPSDPGTVCRGVYQARARGERRWLKVNVEGSAPLNRPLLYLAATKMPSRFSQ